MVERMNTWKAAKLKVPLPLEAAPSMRKSLESSRIYEPNYYLFWSVYRRAHDPDAAPKDAPNEARDCRVRHSKDVPVMWVDHISTEGVLLGVRQVSYIGGVFGYTQVNRDSSCDVLGQSTEIVRCGSA